MLEELGLDYTVKVHYRTAAGRAPDDLKKIISLGSVSPACSQIREPHKADRQAPAVQLDGEVLHESGYIITRLLELSSSKDVETKPSNDSQYWAAFAEGTLMVWMQAGTIVKGTSRGFAGAALGGEGNEKGREALQSYASWVQVSLNVERHIR